MTTDALIPELLRLHDLPPSSPQAYELRWQILGDHGVTRDTPTVTFCWALTVLCEMQEDAVVLSMLRNQTMEPADVLDGLGKKPADWILAENVLLCMVEEAQQHLQLAGRAAELVSVS